MMGGIVFINKRDVLRESKRHAEVVRGGMGWNWRYSLRFLHMSAHPLLESYSEVQAVMVKRKLKMALSKAQHIRDCQP